MRIARLARQHPALHTLPRWLLLTVVNSLLMEGVRATSGLRLARAGEAAPEFAGTALAAAVLWVPLTVFLVVTAFKPRCGDLHLALPLPARSLWRAHLASLALAGGAVLGLAAVAATAHDLILLRGAPAALRDGVGAVVPASIVCLLCAVTLLAAWSPARQRVRPTPGALAWAIVVTAGAFPAAAALSRLPPAVLLVPLALVALVVWRTERSLPQALEMATDSRPTLRGRSGARTGAAGEGWGAAATPGRRRTAALVFRILNACNAGVIMLPMLLLYGFLLAGALFVLTGDSAERAERDAYFGVWGLLTVFLLLTPLPKQMRGLHLLDALPLSRRFLFALMALPGPLAAGLGYLTGAILAARAAPVAAAGGAVLVSPAVWHPCAAVFIAVPYFLLAAALMRLYAPGLGAAVRKVGIVAVPGLALVAGFSILALGIGKVIAMTSATHILKCAAAAIGAAAPGGASTVWLLAAALLVIAYRLAEAGFVSAEIPPESLRETGRGC
jgi:hypothetical protein